MQEKKPGAKIASITEVRKRRHLPDYFNMPEYEDYPREEPGVEAAMWKLMDLIFPKAEVIPLRSTEK